MVKMTCTITTTLDKDVFALVVYSEDENHKWPIKLYQFVKDEWVFRNEYESDELSISLACGWFHDPGSEKHAKLVRISKIALELLGGGGEILMER